MKWIFVRIALLGITLLGMLMAAAYYSRLGGTTSALDADTQNAIEQMEDLNRSMERMMKDSPGSSFSSPAALEPNSLESQARREMERLRREHGVGEPQPGPDGRIRLQSGGSLAPDEYNRARGTLQAP